MMLCLSSMFESISLWAIKNWSNYHKTPKVVKQKFWFGDFQEFNPIALRKAEVVYNFGLSECNRVNDNSTSFTSLRYGADIWYTVFLPDEDVVINF